MVEPRDRCPIVLKTHHRLLLGDAAVLGGVASESAQLVVTSPPYPMVEMWDEAFSSLVPEARDALLAMDGPRAFEAMHGLLDRVWLACAHALQPGGIACINIGDATRTVDGNFRLFSNHARIVAGMERAGFVSLPDILWRKPTNAPNKFMGSGMLPAGAYVTYEHEYVLVFRKGGKRVFSSTEARQNRRRSAYFWEERNRWFSDLWTDVRGVAQELDATSRERSAAYPMELAFRLIQMFSAYGDVVLDPFVGTGTTMAAAVASGRSSVGIELDAGLADVIEGRLSNALGWGQTRAARRLAEHKDFVTARTAAGKSFKHRNMIYDVPVVTAQETDLQLNCGDRLSANGNRVWDVDCAPVGCG